MRSFNTPLADEVGDDTTDFLGEELWSPVREEEPFKSMPDVER